MMSPGAVRDKGSARPAASWLKTRCQGPCRAGSVLFHAPSFAFQAPGGGENQLVQTGRHLEALGVSVRLFSPWTDRLEQARVLHLFGMSREGLELARRARARGTPVVLSPICWFEPAALWTLERRWTRKLGGLAAWSIRRMVPSLPGWRRELLALCDRILPNSRAEARQLVSLFGVAPQRIEVVPNGVLGAFQSASPALFRSRYGGEDFVLFVGRIEPRKNPLGLIRAVRSLGLPLVVMGEAPAETRELLRAVPQRGGRSGQVAGGQRPRRPAAGLGLCGGPGVCPAELVRDAGPGRARGGARGHGRRDHPLWLDPRVFRRPGSIRPARSDCGYRPRDRPIMVARARSSSGGFCRFELSLARRRETNGGGV